MNGKEPMLGVSRTTANHEPYMEISLDLWDYGQKRLITIRMTPENFAKALTGMVSPCKYEIKEIRT